jgi:hypothetical protein
MEDEREEGEIEVSGPEPKRPRQDETQGQGQQRSNSRDNAPVSKAPVKPVAASFTATAAPTGPSGSTGQLASASHNRQIAADWTTDASITTATAQDPSSQAAAQGNDDDDDEDKQSESDPAAVERARLWKEKQAKRKAEELARVQAQLLRTQQDMAALQAKRNQANAGSEKRVESRKAHTTGSGNGKGEKNSVYQSVHSDREDQQGNGGCEQLNRASEQRHGQARDVPNGRLADGDSHGQHERHTGPEHRSSAQPARRRSLLE